MMTGMPVEYEDTGLVIPATRDDWFITVSATRDENDGFIVSMMDEAEPIIGWYAANLDSQFLPIVSFRGDTRVVPEDAMGNDYADGYAYIRTHMRMQDTPRDRHIDIIYLKQQVETIFRYEEKSEPKP